MCVWIRKGWSNEACIDTLRLGIRYSAAKVVRRAQKVVSYYGIRIMHGCIYISIPINYLCMYQEILKYDTV